MRRLKTVPLNDLLSETRPRWALPVAILVAVVEVGLIVWIVTTAAWSS